MDDTRDENDNEPEMRMFRKKLWIQEEKWIRNNTLFIIHSVMIMKLSWKNIKYDKENAYFREGY